VDRDKNRSALGLDLGAVSVAAVLLSPDGEVVRGRWVAHEGDFRGAAARMIEGLPLEGCQRLGVTGSRAGALFADQDPLDEIVCLVEGIRRRAPEVRSILSVGGERSVFVELDPAGRYLRHSENGSCAAGTGLFLEQQAATLDLTLDSLEAVDAGSPDEAPRVATRCAVFARSDLIHLLQAGHDLGEVGKGLCHSFARALQETLLGGRQPGGPVAFVGGVARIPAITAALELVLGCPVARLPAPEQTVAAGAAALSAPAVVADLPALLDRGPHPGARSPGAAWHRPLPPRPTREDPQGVERWNFRETDVTRHGDPLAGPLWFGLDIGSRSTKATLLDERGEVVSGFYTWTDGRPLRATRQILRAIEELARRAGGELEIRGVATTGSGRALLHHVLEADLELDEVTAHARGALHLDPEVDTILEIGGQDSKYTRLDRGHVVHVEMNHACAAGTGSFIEEQARRLGVELPDVERLAVGAEAPPASERCTLFMERDVSRLMVEGCPTPSILAAVLRSVCENYLNKVASSYPVGQRVVMQGATALNGALVAAFEQRLGQPVAVSRFCHLTGALGAALTARSRAAAGAGQRPFDLPRALERCASTVATSQETCGLCPNRCLLSTITVAGATTGWGMRCGRALEDPGPRGSTDRPVLDTHQRIRGAETAGPAVVSGSGRGRPLRIGLPRGLYLLEQDPLWRHFWTGLGAEVMHEPPEEELLQRGRRLAGVMTCAPAALLLGQADRLLELGCDHLFMPTLVRGDGVGADCDVRVSEQRTDAYYCFVSQYLPTLLRSRGGEGTARLISPVLSLNQPAQAVASAIHDATAGKLHLTRRAIQQAYEQALATRRATSDALQAQGRRALAATRARGGLSVALLGMPYVALDSRLNLGVPGLLEQRGATVLTADMLVGDLTREPLDELEQSGTHWQYGKKSLAAALRVAREPDLYPVYLSASYCGPDALLIPRLREQMERAGKPCLVLQLDAQGSDTGLVTRIEAGLETFRDHQAAERARDEPDLETAPGAPASPVCRRLHRRGTFLVPNIDPVICRLWEAAFAGCGYSVYFFQQTAQDVLEGQRFSGGGECLAIPGITGGAIRTLRQIGARDRSVFVPTCSYSCVYPEFSSAVRRALDRAGFPGVPVYAPNLFSLFPGASLKASNYIWECVAATDLLRRAAFEVRPDERRPGDTDTILEQGLCQAAAVLRAGGNLHREVGRVLRELSQVPRSQTSRPRIMLVGNLFLRFNPQLSHRVALRIEELGARVISPPVSDYTLTARLQNRRLLQQGRAPLRRRLGNHLFARMLEAGLSRYERLARRAGVPSAGPPFAEMERHVSETLDLPWSLGGETLSVLGRVLQAVHARDVDAVVHVNSIFCQPAFVSEALLERVLEQAGIPLLNLYCEGSTEHGATGLEPLVHFLNQNNLSGA